MLQRAMILAPGNRIEAEHLCLPGSAGPAATVAAMVQGAQPAQPAPEGLPTDMKGLERAHILATLEAAGGVRRVAAQRLGMSERTLRYKLAQYRLEAAGGEGGQEGAG